MVTLQICAKYYYVNSVINLNFHIYIQIVKKTHKNQLLETFETNHNLTHAFDTYIIYKCIYANNLGRLDFLRL